MRFEIRVDTVWRPLLFAGVAVPANSYVEVGARTITFRFGLLFHHTFPREDVEVPARIEWPLWMGIGWRNNLSGRIGLIGSRQGVVEVRFKKRERIWGIFHCDRIAVSLEDPDGFLAEIRREPEPVVEQGSRAASARRSAGGSRRPRRAD